MVENDITIILPEIFAIDQASGGNRIRQLLEADRQLAATAEPYTKGRTKGYLLTSSDDADPPILIVENGARPPEGFDRVLRAVRNPDAPHEFIGERWLSHPALGRIPSSPIDYPARVHEALASWRDNFAYITEDPTRGRRGLRPPQLGATHAVHAHWAVDSQTATIVMPTGTGKTETMLSVLLSYGCERLLVVVPTDALRSQIAKKFLTLGVLKAAGVVSATAHYPLVGTLKHRPRSIAEVDALFERCNVVVTTAQIAGSCAPEVQARIAELCPFLFVDEAHHAAAPTWHAFRRHFAAGRVLQFTATPFRNDGRHIGGKMIFNYPLRRALTDGYFKPIRFTPIVAFNRQEADERIAARAIEQLRADLASYDHILMARVASVERAQAVFAIYQRYPEFNPVQLHTGIASARQRAEIRQQIVGKKSRIVVCVDMLGEGFDLPELKIAAFHDVKKSLAVTLQLAGRFTRGRVDLGEPTFVANIGDVEVRDELARLYTQDADWNELLIESSARATQEQSDLWEFLDGFRNFPDDIPLQNLRPAISTVIYRTKCEQWMPERVEEGLPNRSTLERLHHDTNPAQNTLVAVTARKVPIDWMTLKEIYDWQWDLYIAHWSPEQQLLFIHGSSNNGHFEDLAKAIAGEHVELVTGPTIFRTFAGITRLTLQNVGLAEQLGRFIRYVMRAGPDIESGLTEAQKRNARKANITGIGYENGERVSLGCSYKGRIWSRKTGNLDALTQWCRQLGRKVLDETIDPDAILQGTLATIQIAERPARMPIGIEWPSAFYEEAETAYTFSIDGSSPVPLYAAELRLVEATEGDALSFALVTEETSIALTLDLFTSDGVPSYRFRQESGRSATIKIGRRETPLEAFFYLQPPTIWFVDGSALEGNNLTTLRHGYPAYQREKITPWDWSGTNIRKESQGTGKAADSIQYRVIERLKREPYTIVFDDDGAGEAADVVAICVTDQGIIVELYHCKFSHGDAPGRRVSDLYELCGQAQKSIHWMDNPIELFKHLLRREALRERGGRPSGFEQGDSVALSRIIEISRIKPVRISISIVQPGLSRAQASAEQLELLGVTENYLMETYKLPFAVIASS